jgi:predicted methyltransferase
MKRALLALLLTALPLSAQPVDTLTAAPNNVEGQSPGVHPLTGRQFALPMSAAGAAWLDRDERQREEDTELSLRLLEVQYGSVVADVGAGSGYYSARLARLVGSNGRVYASDIQQAMLDIIRGRIERERIPNIELVLGTPTDPRLPRGAENSW